MMQVAKTLRLYSPQKCSHPYFNVFSQTGPMTTPGGITVLDVFPLPK
ncbi:MAG: hypothetical protein AAF959_05550 [Cyanobacteria bacterium P01_D01_bin.56]